MPAVLDGRVDAVFARPPLPEALVRRTLVLTEPRVLAMSTAHRLTDLQELRSTDLAGTVQVDTENVDPFGALGGHSTPVPTAGTRATGRWSTPSRRCCRSSPAQTS